MPDLVLNLANRRILANCMTSLHPCIRYNRFEREGILSFVPPDGHFKLFEYKYDSFLL